MGEEQKFGFRVYGRPLALQSVPRPADFQPPVRQADIGITCAADRVTRFSVYNGKQIRLPIIGDLAEKQANK